MKPYRKTGVAVGLLFVTATIAFLAAHTLIRSALSHPDILIGAAADAIALTTAPLPVLVCGVAGIAVALLMYPLFKPHSGRLALGYVAFRVGELGPIIAWVVGLFELTRPIWLIAKEVRYEPAGIPISSR